MNGFLVLAAALKSGDQLDRAMLAVPQVVATLPRIDATPDLDAAVLVLHHIQVLEGRVSHAARFTR